MISRKLIVRSEAGLQVKSAHILAATAESCSSRVEILYQNNIINAKSLLNIVSVAIARGSEIELRCTGPEEAADLERILNVLENLK